MRCFYHVANLVRTKRVNHPQKYSQSELSRSLGYRSGQFISNVERALCSIPLKMLKRASEVLDICPEELKQAILKDQEETLNGYLEDHPGVTNPFAKDNIQSEDDSSLPHMTSINSEYSGP